MDRPSVLVVDDDPDGRVLLAERLQESDLDVFTCGDAYLGLERVRDFPPHLIVTDHFLPGMLGSEFIERVREFSVVPIIGLSARASIELCDAMHRAGASRFLEFREAVREIGFVALELLSSRSDATPIMTLSQARSRRAEDEVARYSALVAAFDGNISAIARHTGVDRSTIQYHLTRLGLR